MKLIRPNTIDDAAFLSSNVAATDEAAWDSGTTYALGDRVQVDATDSHKIYESLQAANTNHIPASSPTWWVEVGSTNRWAMFDGVVGSQTTNADTVTVSLRASGRIDSVALLNLTAASVSVTMTDATAGVVYERSQSMVWDGGIADWWSWMFEPIVRRPDVVFGDLPPYSDAQIDIVIDNTGGTAGIGVCVLGLSREIGGTAPGASIGIQDYSTKTTDDFGNVSVTERAYAKRANLAVNIEASLVDEVQRLLAAYRAQPIVYHADDQFAALIIYGFYREFSVVIPGPFRATCNIEIEGLI